MKALFALVLFPFMGMYVHSQDRLAPGDTTVIISAGARVAVGASELYTWEHIPDLACVKFEYPNRTTIVITSSCSETQRITLKRGFLKPDMEGEPLLDVPRPK